MKRIKGKKYALIILAIFICGSVFTTYGYNDSTTDLDYGKNPLRNHLLLMTNLAINDYYDKKLRIVKGKLILKEKKIISSSATKSEENHSSASDAEMHQFSTMSNANSESATDSKKRRLGT